MSIVYATSNIKILFMTINVTLCVISDICFLILDTGIGELVEPMVWYYQKTFDLPIGILNHKHYIIG